MTTILHYRIDLVGMVVLRMGTHPQKIREFGNFRAKESGCYPLSWQFGRRTFPEISPSKRGFPVVLGNLTTQGYAKAMVSTFGNTYFGEAVVKRSASMELRTRLVIACLGFLSLLRRAHNPKVGSSNLPPATKRRNAGILVIPAFFRILGPDANQRQNSPDASFDANEKQTKRRKIIRDHFSRKAIKMKNLKIVSVNLSHFHIIVRNYR